MLSTDQLAHLEDAERDVKDKQIILKTAIDIQALLRILVDKEIVTKEEIIQYRDEVANSSKYKSAYMYIEQTLEEIERYKKDQTALLKEMLNRKMQGK